MQVPWVVVSTRRTPGRRRLLRLRVLLPALVGLLIVARVVFHYAAEITINAEFYDLLGMGSVYELRWRWGIILALAGIALTVLLASPVLLIGRAVRRAAPAAGGPRPAPAAGPLTEEEIERITRRLETVDLSRLSGGGAGDGQARAVRLALLAGFGVALLVIGGVLVPGLVDLRDTILAAREAVPFGRTDPVFGRDVSFFVFTEPAIRDVVQLATSALFLAAFAAVASGLALWYTQRQRGALLASRAALERTLVFGFGLGGAFLLCLAVLLWLSRYSMTVGGSEVVAGAGAAARDIDIPTRAVGAVVLGVLALGLVALTITPVRRRASITRLGPAALIAVGVWGVSALALVVLADAWWLVLAVPVGVAALLAWRGRTGPWARRDTPLWAAPAFCAVSAIVLSALGPVGALLNDAIVLRGSTLQVERENIANTLAATRRAAGIDGAREVAARYVQGGVTPADVRRAPASVTSLRFLDLQPTQEACARTQNLSQFYTCADVDVDRYVIDGTPRTLFTIGREIDYSRIPDFQPRHFSYTHGYGFISAPVNEIDQAGRPRWIARDIPQRGVEPPLTHPEIYFGAQPGMPWSMVDTDQAVFDGTSNRRGVEWCTGADAVASCGAEGGTGIRVGSGWRRLAVTEYLGGLPYIGGGRRVWNATSGRPAGPDSRLLIRRDIRDRVHELAPFLRLDADPLFATAGGRLWVMLPAFVATDRYPYAARFGGNNYVRQPVTAVMDAYSGQTYLFVTDPAEPMLATWRKVYPDLFRSLDDMDRLAPGLRAHLRYGEDIFSFQAAALQRFHVTDPETFFNGSDTWAPTQERYGPGAEGTQIVSPARYTYAVLPGETRERFLLIRAFKPATPNRGIGFSGWLAVSNDPADFGRLTVVNFPNDGRGALESVDTFTGNVGRDPQLSKEIGQRRDAVVRGNTIVVPVGRGLLYVQPLYLDSGDTLPQLWQVVVGVGDGRVFFAPSFQDALEQALGAGAGDGGGGTGTPATIQELVVRASTEFDAYQRAFGEGDFVEAARRLERFRRALARARALADQARAGGTLAP